MNVKNAYAFYDEGGNVVYVTSQIEALEHRIADLERAIRRCARDKDLVDIERRIAALEARSDTGSAP